MAKGRVTQIMTTQVTCFLIGVFLPFPTPFKLLLITSCYLIMLASSRSPFPPHGLGHQAYRLIMCHINELRLDQEHRAAARPAWLPSSQVPAEGVPAEGVPAEGVPAEGVPAERCRLRACWSRAELYAWAGWPRKSHFPSASPSGERRSPAGAVHLSPARQAKQPLGGGCLRPQRAGLPS